ncbi:MAG: hypothetical protein AB7G11_02635 [Phycisphaerales bacterium]
MALDLRFVSSLLAKAEQNIFMGQPVKDFTREELLVALDHVGQSLTRAQAEKFELMTNHDAKIDRLAAFRTPVGPRLGPSPLRRLVRGFMVREAVRDYTAKTLRFGSSSSDEIA